MTRKWEKRKEGRKMMFKKRRARFDGKNAQASIHTFSFDHATSEEKELMRHLNVQ